MLINRKVMIDGQEMVATITKYQGSNVTGIQVYDSEGPYIRLTTNLADLTLHNDLVVVPTYNIDQSIVDDLVKQGFWEKTDRSIRYNFGEMPIYRLLFSLEESGS